MTLEFIEHPEHHIKTTYKTRCMNGLGDPNSDACHKAARAFSKYCSETCGLAYMKRKAQAWQQSGGRTEDLWDTVKDTEERAGVMYIVDENNPNSFTPAKPTRSRADREVERLEGLLDKVVKLREELRQGLDIIAWRKDLSRLASDRGAQMGVCGWDQRLCYGDKEYYEDGESALLTYGEDISEEDMSVDGYGMWWCEEANCSRHAE